MDRPRPRHLRPAPRITPWGLAAVRASYRLSAGAKLVYAIIADLDRGAHGCWLSPAELARQVGLDFSTFKELRAELRRHGLLTATGGGGPVPEHWYAVWPEGLGALDVPGATVEERRRWVRETADRLDAMIAAPPADGNPVHKRTEIPTGNAASGRLSRPVPDGNPDRYGHKESDPEALSVTLKAVVHELSDCSTDSASRETRESNSDPVPIREVLEGKRLRLRRVQP